ncbi:hypothetical protein HDK77DRAFT_193500 [Phyllosticta capitalensis]
MSVLSPLPCALLLSSFRASCRRSLLLCACGVPQRSSASPTAPAAVIDGPDASHAHQLVLSKDYPRAHPEPRHNDVAALRQSPCPAPSLKQNNPLERDDIAETENRGLGYHFPTRHVWALNLTGLSAACRKRTLSEGPMLRGELQTTTFLTGCPPPR